jgi:hypothetical protein
MAARIEVVEDRSRQIVGACREAVSRAVRKAVLDIEAGTKRRITENDSIDTGAMRASVHGDCMRHHGYADAANDAYAKAEKPGKKSKQSRADLQVFPEVRAEDEFEGIVTIGVEYAINVELGTARQSPQPALGPAATEVLDEWDKVITELVNIGLGR